MRPDQHWGARRQLQNNPPPHSILPSLQVHPTPYQRHLSPVRHLSSLTPKPDLAPGGNANARWRNAISDIGATIMWIEERIGRRVRLIDLHILKATAETGSMSKAARRLNTSQPAISRCIADL